MEFKIFGVIWFMVVTLINAEVIKYEPCPNVSEDHCNITEIKINPCKEVPKACKLKKGTNATITFDYIPKFNATKLKSMVYSLNGGMELKFSGFDDNACALTPCPTTAGQSQQYNYRLYIGKKYPTGTFNLKWILWNEDDETQACCFISSINMRR